MLASYLFNNLFNVLFTQAVFDNQAPVYFNHTIPYQSLQETSPQNFYFTLTFIAIFLVIFLRLTFQSLKSYRTVKDIPLSKIRSAAQGFLGLQGTQQAFMPELKSPLTYSNCTWYDYTIEEKIRRKSEVEWQIIYHDQSSQPFFLEDGTGKCLIFPHQAEVVTQDSFIKYWRKGQPWQEAYPANEPLGKYLQIFWLIGNIVTLGYLTTITNSQRYRHTEKIMHTDDFIYALGFFQSYSGTLDDATLQQYLGSSSEILNTAVRQALTEAPHTSSQIHTLSVPPREHQVSFLLSNFPEKQVAKKQLIQFYVLLAVDIFLLLALIIFVSTR